MFRYIKSMIRDMPLLLLAYFILALSWLAYLMIQVVTTTHIIDLLIGLGVTAVFLGVAKLLKIWANKY